MSYISAAPMPGDRVAIPISERHSRDQTSLRRSHSLTFSERNGLPLSNRKNLFLGGIARHTLGIGLLLITVVLWTASSFLASVSPTPYHHAVYSLHLAFLG